MSFRERVTNILSYSNDKKSDIISLLNGIGDPLPILPIGLRAGSKLIRGSINWVPEHFTHVSQLSYRPPELNCEYQRASIPRKTMFYACSFSHSSTFETGVFMPRLTSLMEIRSLITDRDANGVQRITFSRWDTTRNIKLFALPFGANYEKPCEEIGYLRAIWEEKIGKDLYSKDAIDLIAYISLDISQKKENNTDYMFTAIFIDWFLSRHPEYDGVYYPSVQVDGEGVNVALLPYLVDNGSVSFVDATECWLLKRGEVSKLMNAFSLNRENDRLIASQEDTLLQQLFLLCKDFQLDGLSFIN